MNEFLDSLSQFWDSLSEETKVAVYISVSGVLGRLLIDLTEYDAVWAMIVAGVINVLLVFLKNRIRHLKEERQDIG